MSSVLFDTPGPRARARHRIVTLICGLIVLGVAGWVVMRLVNEDVINEDVFYELSRNNIWRAIRDGLVATLQAAAISIATAIAFGMLFAFGRLSEHGWLRWPCVAVIEFFRAVPLIMLMFLFFFGLPSGWNPIVAVIVALTLYNGSVLAEVFRAGINAVASGQSEAAYAIGMGKAQVMTIILLPQAVRFMLPAIVSQCVVVLKDTSLGYLITYPELVRQGRAIALSVDNYLVTFTLIALIFVLINYSLSRLATYLEKRLRQRGGPAMAEDVQTVAANTGA